MTVELIVQATPKSDSVRQHFDERVITIGRDPSSTLRFDMSADLEVSTRHAEIHEHDGRWFIIDRNSTNGTWVNGARVNGKRDLYPGDVVNLGRSGPELRVAALGEHVWQQTVESPVHLPPIHLQPSWRANRTREWMVHMVETRTRTLKLAVTGVGAAILVLGLIGWLYMRTLASEDPQVWREVTAPSIRRANDDAVVLVETQIPGPSCGGGCEGTGFSVRRDGLIVTNRHVVMQQGAQATRIRVKFANTQAWIAAHLVRVATDISGDVALIQVDEPGGYPSVVGISANGSDLPVGSVVMTIGFPLGTTLKMDGTGASTIARTTMTTGSIAKVLRDLIQIDAFAYHGSSGSPVFDRHGHAIGVVSGGPRQESDRIVYVVPANRILELEKAAGLAVSP